MERDNTIVVDLNFRDEFGEITEPLPKQKEVLSSDARLLLFCGGWGAGKTQAILRRHALISLYSPGLRSFLGRFEAEQTYTELVLPFLDIIGELLISHVERKRMIMMRTIDNEKPAVVLYGGLDPAKGARRRIRGSKFGLITVDQLESIPEDMFWELVAGRLRQTGIPKRYFQATANPVGGIGHYIYRFFVKKEIPQKLLDAGFNAEDICYVHADTFENIYLPKDYVVFLKGLPEPLYRQFVLGKWESAEGRVYSEIKVIPSFQIPSNWLVFRVFDYGYTHPFVCLFFAISPEGGEVHLFREYYESGKHFHEHLIEVDKLSIGLNIASMDFADPHIFNKTHTGFSIAEDMESFARNRRPPLKFQFLPADNNKQVGIPRTYQFLREKCVIHDCCVKTIKELNELVWDTKRMRESQELVTKGADHACDAIRYFANEFDRIMQEAERFYGRKIEMTMGDHPITLEQYIKWNMDKFKRGNVYIHPLFGRRE